MRIRPPARHPHRHTSSREVILTAAVVAALAVAMPAQQRFAELGGQLLGLASYVNSIALGDVDGDGDLDVVCGTGYQTGHRPNRLYLNDGSGAFTEVTASQMPVILESTRSVALGDVDNDGDLDLACGNGRTRQQLGRAEHAERRRR